MERSASRTTGTTGTPGAAGPPAKRRRRGARETARLVGSVLLAVLITLFAVFNLDRVNVNWIVGTFRTPLIIVIAVSVLVGIVLDRMAMVAARRRARTRKGAAAE